MTSHIVCTWLPWPCPYLRELFNWMGACSPFVFMNRQKMQEPYEHKLCASIWGWSKTDRVRAASGSPSNFIGCCLDNHLLCQGPGTFPPLQYCILFTSFSHPGSSEILGSPGIVSSPSVTLGTGAKHSWRKLAPFSDWDAVWRFALHL